MKQFFKSRWFLGGLGVLFAVGGYLLHHNTSWYYKASSNYDPANPPVKYYGKANGAQAFVRSYSVPDFSQMQNALENRVFRYAQKFDSAKGWVLPGKSAMSTGIAPSDGRRRVTVFIRRAEVVDYLWFEFPKEANYLGEVSQFLRTEFGWSHSFNEFQLVNIANLCYKFQIEKKQSIELPARWFEFMEDIPCMPPMYVGGSDRPSVTYQGIASPYPDYLSKVTLYAANSFNNLIEEKQKKQPFIYLAKTWPATSDSCQIREYCNPGIKQNVWFLIKKKDRECALIAEIQTYPPKEISPKCYELAEHIAREWAKLPD
ncbi:MAG: hypothetical protein K8R88_03280 [Armatimonadetes bacterium]|nr:hypothetical protein [Armatimonadota bacterium]